MVFVACAEAYEAGSEVWRVVAFVVDVAGRFHREIGIS
jgi:hypothetical protein